MVVRLINEKDYQNVAEMISKSVSNSAFAKFYPRQSIEYIKEMLDENGIRKRASWTHFYVIEDNEQIVACGAIGPYWDSEDESSLFNIFVDEKYQGQGYGRKIIETLEKDEYFTRARRIEVPASMSAIPFYRKMGYDFKNGIKELDDEKHFRLEKFR